MRKNNFKKKTLPHSRNNFAKKNLGQNFLVDREVRGKILELSGNISGKNILEIGPGLGFLTTSLLHEKCHLTAIELDERACKVLQEDLGHKENFQLLNQNFLETNLEEIFGDQPYSVIANIPYNITAPIIKKLCSQTQNKPKFAVLMVQKEVAEKIVHQKKRSILSLSIEIFAETQYGFTVPSRSFSPAPKVDSAVIRLDMRKKDLIDPVDQILFFRLVHAGFSQKRKKLGNVLGNFFSYDPKAILGDVDANRRAENLEISEWQTLIKNLKLLQSK